MCYKWLVETLWKAYDCSPHSWRISQKLTSIRNLQNLPQHLSEAVFSRHKKTHKAVSVGSSTQAISASLINSFPSVRHTSGHTASPSSMNIHHLNFRVFKVNWNLNVLTWFAAFLNSLDTRNQLSQLY